MVHHVNWPGHCVCSRSRMMAVSCAAGGELLATSTLSRSPARFKCVDGQRTPRRGCIFSCAVARFGRCDCC